ncbi:hypothetical protein IEQ34_000564 [Dendrobium chrysotoxum]|uniref:Two-component response regulator-like PRR95 n=1 Tax=Dendrobium chrysotoxum TaxID=161865 RepID=A0AAV7HQ87_DENCH|nr:hypothetical protein IEQ34_000564 [Dendrobium chrysotoxum]
MQASCSTNCPYRPQRGERNEERMGGEEVNKAVGLEEEVEEEGEEVTWEKLLLREPVRVLLVEPDDSTRQIIAALLRKCGYRVTVASDGLKAWETLREKYHNIDLVLTEVELPKISGVVLLTMMMEQDSCNHIPVIMMSSNDSVSIAFKCMIKGAADFLVKPIRKNELKNLWQHFWRKRKGEIAVTRNEMVDVCYDHCPIKNATDEQDDVDCCEKESDAQSSCTRSDMEVESTCKLRNNMDLNQARHRNFSLFDDLIIPNNHYEKQSDGISLFPNDEANGVISLGSDIQPEGKINCQEVDRDESSMELFDLNEVINNQPKRICISENSRDNFAENLHVDIELEKKSSSMLSLELSLDGYSHDNPNKQENDGSNTLHHSNSSAFSLYTNNSTADPNFQAQNKGSTNGSIELSPYQSAVNPLHYNGLIPEPDGTKFMNATLSSQEGTAFRCTPIRLIPFPVPVGEICAGSNPFLQSIFYPQSAPAFWGAMPSTIQGTFTENHPYQSGFNDFKSAECHNQEHYSLKSHDFQGHHKQEEAVMVDEQRHVSAVTGDSASVCNDSGYNLNENGSTGVSNENNRPVTTFNTCESSARSGDDDAFQTFGELKSANQCHLSQREAALNKFRLKRKERCFEKKVRYLSRKKLAEQRPRVRGQFVRQV